jgi:cytochrome b subunit of formate dehydrogenase
VTILKSLIPLVGFWFAIGLPVNVAAQTSRDCLACHGDKTLQGTRDGATVSVYVDSARLAASRHGPATCVACHTDLVGKPGPHPAKLARVACRGCHVGEVQDVAQSLHGKAVARGDPLAPSCGSCHGSHDIVAMKDPRSPVLPVRVAALCGSCHREGAPVHRQQALRPADAPSNYPERIHGDLLAKKGIVAAATCVSCHTAHRILPQADDRSSIARRNIVSTCSQCHTQLATLHQKVIPVAAWKTGPPSLLACVTCHVPHGARAGLNTANAASRECQRCHERPDITSSTDGHTLWVASVELAGSMHKTLACTQCHAGVEPSHQRPSGPSTRKVDCSSCHAEMARQYRLSTHGQLEAKTDTNAPSCAECHGTHSILSKHNLDSPTFPLNVPTLCARCHRTGEKAAVKYSGRQTKIVEGYTESIHGLGLIKSGLIVTATCTSCHTAHGELPHDSVASSVSSANVPATCGACHAGIQEKFETSVHSVKVTATTKPLPVCNDCHSAHTIGRTDAAGFKLVIMERCGKCHEAIAKTYFDTYHGKVSRLGFTRTAQCYDCHGSHEILAARDPRSPLSTANIVGTCQKCHPGAGSGFAAYLPHATHTDRAKYPALFWTFWAMTALLVGTFTVFGVHTLFWLRRGLILKRQARATAAAAAGTEDGEQLVVASTAVENSPEHAVDPTPAVTALQLVTLPTPPENALEYRRFTRLNRVLHIVMIVSFILLAATGMTLKFSNTRWASILSHLLGGFQTAGYIHRFSAVLMIGLFVTHLVDLVRRPRDSWKDLLSGPNTMVPTRKDVADIIGTIKWFLSRGPRPRYGRWTYWEKFDYMAVFWGMVVIGSTGLTLWFPVFATRFFPGWLLNVATIIHSDEALLATGFIFTVHFFNTHLRPEKFPMDIVVFTGSMTVEELRHDKPAEYDALVASGELEKNLVVPYPPVVIGVIRAFGWTALTVGVAIAAWIVYAMLFANG